MKPLANRPLDYYLLWLAVIVSLGMNLYLFNIMLQARAQVGNAAGVAAEAVGSLRTAAIDYPVVIDESLPISLTIDYNEDITVPISVTLPINTNVSVPLRTPLGTFPINVPVVTTIPVNLSPVVPLSVAIPVSLTVPVHVEVPIHIELADTPLGDSLGEAEAYLNDLSDDLSQPAIPLAFPAATATAPR